MFSEIENGGRRYSFTITHSIEKGGRIEIKSTVNENKSVSRTRKTEVEDTPLRSHSPLKKEVESK